MTSTLALYPLETLRTRLAMGDYDNMAHAVRAVAAEEGPMAFYQVQPHQPVACGKLHAETRRHSLKSCYDCQNYLSTVGSSADLLLLQSWRTCCPV